MYSKYKPVTSKRLLELETAEISVIKGNLSKLSHLRRGLWDKGTSNQEEVLKLLEVDRNIEQNENRLDEIIRIQKKRNGPKKTDIHNLKNDITAQSKGKKIIKTRTQESSVVVNYSSFFLIIDLL